MYNHCRAGTWKTICTSSLATRKGCRRIGKRLLALPKPRRDSRTVPLKRGSQRFGMYENFLRSWSCPSNPGEPRPSHDDLLKRQLGHARVRRAHRLDAALVFATDDAE